MGTDCLRWRQKLLRAGKQKKNKNILFISTFIVLLVELAVVKIRLCTIILCVFKLGLPVYYITLLSYFKRIWFWFIQCLYFGAWIRVSLQKQSVKLASNVVLLPFCGKGCGSEFREREKELRGSLKPHAQHVAQNKTSYCGSGRSQNLIKYVDQCVCTLKWSCVILELFI